MSEYIQKGKTSKITATSRIALKIRDNFYTVEFSEERTLPIDDASVDVEKEKDLLWQSTNDCVDAQARDIMELLSKPQR